MKKTTTPVQTPSPQARSAKDAGVDSGKSPREEFIAATLTMSWQLAIVVLVPIIGGFELDEKLHMLPLLTIVGFGLAMIGMAVVIWRQLQLVSPPLPPAHHHKGPRS